MERNRGREVYIEISRERVREERERLLQYSSSELRH